MQTPKYNWRSNCFANSEGLHYEATVNTTRLVADHGRTYDELRLQLDETHESNGDGTQTVTGATLRYFRNGRQVATASAVPAPLTQADIGAIRDGTTPPPVALFDRTVDANHGGIETTFALSKYSSVWKRAKMELSTCKEQNGLEYARPTINPECVQCHLFWGLATGLVTVAVYEEARRSRRGRGRRGRRQPL